MCQPCLLAHSNFSCIGVVVAGRSCASLNKSGQPRTKALYAWASC